MMWLWVVGIVAVVGAVAVVAVGSGASLSEVYEDRPDRTIAVGRPLRADDLRDVTFTTAVRGYRMDEVDALLARIRADMLTREANARQPDDDAEAQEPPGQELPAEPPPATAEPGEPSAEDP
jgi:DivIVA domain-containing protein